MPGSVANARPYSFSDALFFSIETLATVGYGEMYPATLYGHVIAATEIVSGLGFTAILTGLTFVRFSRPRAKLVFASYPVVAMHNGKPTLMLRVGNGRANVPLDATTKLNVLLSVTTAEGNSSAARKNCGLSVRIFRCIALLLIANMINLGVDLGSVGDVLRMLLGGPSRGMSRC